MVAAMQRRGPQRTRRRDPKPPFQNFKGKLLMVFGRTRAPPRPRLGSGLVA